MVLPRPTALRASSIARFARPARSIRSAELQPWQQMVQRRTYASGHGAGEAKKSDLPWAMAAVAGTAGGLYLVMNQDLSHGEGHGGHGAHHDTPVKEEALEQVEAEAPDAAKEEAKEETKEAKEEIPEDVKEGKRDSLSDKKAEKEEDVDKNAKPEAALQGQSDSKPSETDKPDPRGTPKNTNEQSGKQDATYSNQDTHHPVDVAASDDKSKKGEGVAETAKVKGTVSTERPPAENKEERGKSETNKNA